MICGCLVSRNHYLFHLKSSSSSTSSPNLTICHPHTNLLASRRSSDVPKTPVGIQPPRLGSQGGNDETSISTAFLHHEPEQNYIQFCNPPPPPQKHHHHTLPSTCFHEAYQSLSRQGHLQCSQSVFLSPQIDNRRGLIYANVEQSGRGMGQKWGLLRLNLAAQAATSTFIVDTAASIQQNNHSTAVEISIAPRQSGTRVENQPLCLIAASGIKTLGSAQKSPVPTPVTVAPETHYQLASKLYMMPEFSYCLSSHNTNNGSNNGYQNNGSEDESSQ
ncbi:hypothetical protein ECG_08815 [Echinococcus granulosus]|nr:hypothetical protein ECG_08815 [Echinococcus granulosus]